MPVMVAYAAISLLGAFCRLPANERCRWNDPGGLVGLAIATTLGMVVLVASARAGSPLSDDQPER